jgi:hypothetical protein
LHKCFLDYFIPTDHFRSLFGIPRFGDGAFGKQFTLSQVSKEAQEDTKGKKLWELSEKLVGV